MAATVMFTGHRNMPNDGETCAFIGNVVRALYNAGFRNYITGGAVGFDTIVALEVIALRKNFPDIRLCLALPCPDQTARWHPADVEVYDFIKSSANRFCYTGDSYSANAMHVRNRFMVDHADFCVAYLNDKLHKSGTRATVNYAREKGVRSINIASPDFSISQI